jgi:glycosyltransferase involved in cell wall biosynthesis
MIISIAMATYNGAAFLPEQLASFARQSRLPDELVVTDDGSTDDTLAILDRFSAEVPFTVRVERNPSSLGFAQNFDRALSLTNGDIVFLSDQDDVWADDKIEKVLAVFAAHPDKMSVLHDARLVDQRGEWFGLTQLGVIRRTGVTDQAFVTGCCSAHRKQWLDTIRPMRPGVHHDLWINRSAHGAGVSIILDEPLIDFRRHGQNSSDWPLSAPTQSSGLAIQSHFAAVEVDPAAAWQHVSDLLTSVIERIETRISALPAAAPEREWLRRLVQDRNSFEARLRIVRSSRLRRPPMVLGSLLRGEYRAFSGWRSAAKDLLRPSISQ